MMRHVVRYSIALMLFAALGCGGSKQISVYKAKGKVSLSNGTAVGGGRIEFQPVEDGTHSKPSAQAPINPDGTFVLTTYKPDDGAVEGEHKVLIIAPVPMKPGETVDVPFDPKYSNPKQTDLKFKVTTDPKNNEFDIKLDPKK